MARTDRLIIALCSTRRFDYSVTYVRLMIKNDGRTPSRAINFYTCGIASALIVVLAVWTPCWLPA